MTSYEENMTGYCPQCGAKREPGAKFCSQCGSRYEQETYRDFAGNHSAGERAKTAFEQGFGALLYFLEQKDYIPYEAEENLFIGTNTEYYRSKFDEMRTLKQKVSLNWAALFFGIFWMLYRKMYGVAAGALVATVIAGLLGAAGGAVGLILTVCYGLFGNYLYMMTVQKRVTDVQRYAEPARSQYVEKYAGVSGAAVLIGLVVVGLFSVPFWMIIGLSFLGMIGALL